MKNWQEDLQKFLTIEEEPPAYTTPTGRVKRRKSVIGKLQGGQNILTGILNVAMILSLGKSERLEELVQGYGMVLMDECHHAGADTDTAVLRSVTAKYVYGLTATPKRDDGQIERFSCSSVRSASGTRRRIVRRSRASAIMSIPVLQSLFTFPRNRPRWQN